jgi:hypothetical protein
VRDIGSISPLLPSVARWRFADSYTKRIMRPIALARWLAAYCGITLWPARDCPSARVLSRGDAHSASERQLPDGPWTYIVGTYDKDAGTNNERLYLKGAGVVQMSDTQPIDLNSAALGTGRHVSGHRRSLQRPY